MSENNINRPHFPKRAVVTAGMPYGNKELHFGHIGGVFIPADIYARFLRDRIGKENVIFVSGTDCYGVTIETSYQKAVEDGFQGTIYDYVKKNHDSQEETLKSYRVSPNLFAASALGEAGKIHSDVSALIFNTLYKNGCLHLEETYQFYDEQEKMFLNGRQVTGRCPIQGCKSEIAYADECSLGHQYNPSELINPISTVSGKPPIQVLVKNWFFDLPEYIDFLTKETDEWEKDDLHRKGLAKTMREFLKKPSIYVKRELMDDVNQMNDMPKFTVTDDPQKASVALVYENLDERAKATKLLDKAQIRYRTGKTVVPFRLSGNVKWGITIPDKDGEKDLTFWVWPESLWAPISFTKAYLNEGVDGKKWEDWWKSDDAKVYQFIGEDNIYFYAIAEMGLFNALDKDIRLPVIIPNHHLLYGKTKASSSGAVKPPKATELLDYYTPEQLRLHFANMSLSERSIGFDPKAITGKEGEFDNTLYEGNLVTNIFNRLVRSCFYTCQKYNNGIYPTGTVSKSVKDESDDTILKYEQMMYTCSFDKIFELLNIYLRDANKDWASRSKTEDKEQINQLLIDTFHVIRVCVALFHPLVPDGCEMVRDYLRVDESIYSWEKIFDSLDTFVEKGHEFKFLEPRVDFFSKHDSQVKAKDKK